MRNGVGTPHPKPRLTLTRAFLAAHIALLGVAGLPSPEDVYALRGRFEAPATTPGAIVAPAANRAAAAVEFALNHVWLAVRPLRRAAELYVRTLGLTQDWRMFANPPLANTFLVARFRISNADGSHLSAAEEVLLPAEAGRFRGPAAFALSYRDKALANALAAYDEQQREHPGQSARPTRFGVDPLGPVSRWATNRLEANLPAGRQVRRTGLWRAEIPIRISGTAGGSAARWMLLNSRRWQDRGR